jgi:hypothetical protein
VPPVILDELLSTERINVVPLSSPFSTDRSASRSANLYDATKRPSSRRRWSLTKNPICSFAQGGTVYLTAEADGNTVYLLTFSESNQTYGTWNFTNGILNDSPIAAAAGNVFIAGRDSGGRIYWYSLTGNNWFLAGGAV